MEQDLGSTIIQASIYIYFLALFAGLGLLTASLIGYKLFVRITKKSEIKIKKQKRGVV